MMLLRSLLAAALALAPTQAVPQTAPTSAPVRNSGLYRGDIKEIAPPQRFQGDKVAVVVFGGRPVIEYLCGKPNADGVGPIACTGEKKHTTVMALPNPCAFADFDFYAAIVCHELGHANGWPASHGA